VIGKIGNKWLSAVALVALAVATLSTNIAANVVSPANDFSNLAPRRISFRMGGMITAVIGILMVPWKLYADPNNYIVTWLIGYSALLGPIAGIMIADYYIVRSRKLDVDDLYRADGIYRYTRGFSLAALAVFVLAVLPNLPGFLVQVKLVDYGTVTSWVTACGIAPEHVTGATDGLIGLYQQAWFVGFGLAFVLYLLVRKIAPVQYYR